MVHAVIHAGLHKTGTSSFQNCCHALRAALIQQGVFYPKHTSINHNELVDQPSLDWVDKVIKATRRRTGASGCLLLSAENLEYNLHEDKPECIEAALRKAGVKRVSWVFCFRNPFDAYCSLYGQISTGQNLKAARGILEFGTTGQLIAAKGYLSLQNRRLTQRFHFDYPTLINGLRKRLSGHVIGINFLDFTSQAKTPGDLLIKAITKDTLALSELKIELPRHRNTSPSREDIERNYIQRFFGIKNLKDDSVPSWFQQAVTARLETRTSQEKMIRRLFKTSFNDWESTLTTPEAMIQMLQD